ncbi:excisionase [Variovorax paradoxus]|uniref:excisionase n=1 Tax=Variovorax paradoxus TaxID=34073 RepID=UPI003ECFD66B
MTVGIYAAISGRTQNSIRMKIRDGKWLENREFIRDPDGTILIDREEVQKWALRRS